MPDGTGRVGIGTTQPAADAVLDLSSADGALRITRLTDPVADVATPRNGMLAYDSTDDQLQGYIGGTWLRLMEEGMVDISDDTNLVAGLHITLSGDTLHVDDAFVLNTGDSMSGSLEFVGVASDIITGTNEDLALMPDGTGRVGVGTTRPDAGAILDLSSTDAALRGAPSAGWNRTCRYRHHSTGSG